MPPKKKTIPKPLRSKVWKTHFNTSMVGKCCCCSNDMSFDENYECGHILAEANGGQTIEDNLRPVCRTCNRSMGTTNMEDFKKKFTHTSISSSQTIISPPKETLRPPVSELSRRTEFVKNYISQEFYVEIILKDSKLYEQLVRLVQQGYNQIDCKNLFGTFFLTPKLC